ncbi:hypothetical protein AVEN_33669-1, partial [Araneus ventricosus]
MEVNSVNDEFSFMNFIFLECVRYSLLQPDFSHRIHWRKSGHSEDPDTSPDVSFKSGLSGRNPDV